jgi:hypothetical protein
MVDHIAAAAKPRFLNLLKLRVRHVHELTAGIANEKLVVEGRLQNYKEAVVSNFRLASL